jgi:hypothetical protein
MGAREEQAVMGWVSVQPSLTRCCAARRPFSLDLVREFARQLLQAVACARPLRCCLLAALRAPAG